MRDEDDVMDRFFFSVFFFFYFTFRWFLLAIFNLDN